METGGKMFISGDMRMAEFEPAILILARTLSGCCVSSRFQLGFDDISKGCKLVFVVPDKEEERCLFGWR